MFYESYDPLEEDEQRRRRDKDAESYECQFCGSIPDAKTLTSGRCRCQIEIKELVDDDNEV